MSDAPLPVVVIDDAEDYPDPGPFADLVVSIPGAPDGGLDPARFGTAFVHANNEAEADWAAKHYPVHFVFTGDTLTAPDVSEYEGVYELPRWALERYFRDFLEAYAARGGVDETVADTFFGS